MNAKSQILLALSCAVAVQAGQRGSANYSIATDTTDGGGKRATSAGYTNDGSAGSVAGISTVASPAGTAKSGFVAQLYEVAGLTLTSASPTVDETATVQLTARQALDDATFLAVSSTSVAWSVQSGPLTGVNNNGLATAGTVYQNTAATAQGAYLGNTGTVGLTVVNTLPDNYPGYAGDQVDDDWQVGYFGAPPNANAGPLIDPDGDGQNNLFEFTAGLVPTNPLSRFLLRVEPVVGQPTQKRLVFSPRWTDRTYSVVTSTTLETNSWAALTGGIVSDNGTERSVTDTSATGPKKFYRVDIVKP
jgi:hypothetical protein